MTPTTAPEHLSFRLNDEFVEHWGKQPIRWGFPVGAGNTLGELTSLTKYSREKHEGGAKERWNEVCRRVIEGMFSIQFDHCRAQRTPWNHNKAMRAAEEAYGFMFNFIWTPPGRGLGMMGTEFVMEYGSAALQNCLGGDEQFVTRDGIRTLAEMAGERVEVWDGNDWVKSEVKSFGQQPVRRITFKPGNTRSNRRVEHVATPDHRWVLEDGTVTIDLQVGDRVRNAAVSEVYGDEYAEGFRHGLVFADGSVNYRYKNGDYSHMMRLCGRKAQYAPYFDVIRQQPNCDGDPVVYHRSSDNWKDLPTSDKSAQYIIGFIDGWSDLDGSISPSGATVLSTQDARARDWLIEHAAFGGRIVVGHSVESNMVTNFGERRAPLHKVTLRKPDDAPAWRVVAIEDLEDPEEVFCAVVPRTAQFTLSSGILTGNCAFVTTETIGPRNPTFPFVRLMEMSMLGIGVGFDTRGAGKLTLHKPDPLSHKHYMISDDREGWINSLDLILRSYLLPNQPTITFDYTRLRERGAKIRGFGGRAGGPGVLRTLHERLRLLFDGRQGQAFGVGDIIDVQNMIGSCVAAGNVRRSAEIAFGEQDDKSFLNLKNPFGNARRMGLVPDEDNNPVVGPDGRWLTHPDGGWGNVSNNSVFANVGDDLTHIAEMQAINGEPGIMWLDLAQNYGRMGDPPNGRDYRVRGCNPCAEQSLEPNECCTLVELFPTNAPDWPTFERAIKYAYLYAKTVTLLPTHWSESNEVMTRNRRIGTSMTGIAQYAERHSWHQLRNLCDDSYRVVQRYDDVYSEWLGVRTSIKTTSVKPSGTVSLLGGVWPGVHWPVAEGEYFRRQRFSAEEPVVDMFTQAGYHVEPDVMDPHNSVVVTFPTIGPSGRDQRSVSVWEKVALAALMGKHWCDNMCSATFSFRPDEADQLPAILRAFEGQLKTMSFLPLGDELTSDTYAQLPYEQVDIRTFENARTDAKHIDWDVLYEMGGETDVERGCDNDSCEIPT